LPTFSGLSETQLPTGADEKVAFIEWVGSTQRVTSLLARRYLMFLLVFLTMSSVRTKRQSPVRKLGAWVSETATCSAWACDAFVCETLVRGTLAGEAGKTLETLAGEATA